jgi:glyoxylase-like metal-dependent hydrolase (beta-lactamase superfamily II)
MRPMATRRRRWPRVLGVLGVLLGGAYWWLFVQVPAPQGGWWFDLPEVRRLAASIEGDRPRELRVERVQRFQFPHAVVRAGDGWGLLPMEVFSYQLVFPTHTAILDTALTEALPLGTADAASFARVSRAMAAADLIVVTHEHDDHLGGLVEQPNLAALLKVARLTPEQLSHPELLAPAAFPRGALDGYQPLLYERAVAVAPGVVLIKAAGHSPGSQLVYVQRADGAEYLFLGDVAWTALNVESARDRPRALALLIDEDRGEVMSQLAQLHHLAEVQPEIHQVPGHDPAAVEALLTQHLLEERFKPGGAGL